MIVASFHDLPTGTEPGSERVPLRIVTRLFDMGDTYLATARFHPRQVGRSTGYDGWDCVVQVFHRDAVRPLHKRLMTYGPPLGAGDDALGVWRDGGVVVGHADGAEAPTVAQIEDAARRIIAAHEATTRAHAGSRPMVADVLRVMRQHGVDQDEAVRRLGGQP